MGRKLPIISLFSGALGLDLGLEQAGFKLTVAVECNRFAADTIRTNRPDVFLFERRIEEISTREILDAAGLKAGDPFVLTGGPSCQAFSTAGLRGSMSDPRGVMFREFLRVVREAKPRFFVMENVKGVLSAAIRHRPLNRRGPGYPLSTERLSSERKPSYHVLHEVLFRLTS
jgi:DNA (cytosine-5)-methyltransferase 1